MKNLFISALLAASCVTLQAGTNSAYPLVTSVKSNDLMMVTVSSGGGFLTRNIALSNLSDSISVTSGLSNQVANATSTLSNQVANASLYFDADAVSYGASHGVTNYAELWNLSGFVRTMKQCGAWTQQGLILILRSNYNRSTLSDVTTWDGKAVTVIGTNAMTYNRNGMTVGFNQNQGLWLTGLPDFRTNTTFIQASISYSNWVSTLEGTAMLSLQNGPFGNPFFNSFFAFANFSNFGLGWRAGDGNNGVGTDLTEGLMMDHGRAAGYGQLYALASEMPRIYVGSFSNNTASLQGWLENIPAGGYWDVPNQMTWTNRLHLGTGASTNIMPLPLTNMTVGGQAVSSTAIASYPATWQYVVILTNQVGQAVVDGVNKALRYLDPESDDVLIFGASRMGDGSFCGEIAGCSLGDQRQAWPYQLFQRLSLEGKARVFFYAAPGITPNQMLAGSNFIRAVEFHAPDGIKVKRSTIFTETAAYNAFRDGQTVNQAITSSSNLLAAIRPLGYEINVMPEAPIVYDTAGGSYTTNSAGTVWATWVAGFNPWLITNVFLYDQLNRYDLFFTDTERLTNSGFFSDGIHTSGAGNRRWADRTLMQRGGANGSGIGANKIIGTDTNGMQVGAALSGLTWDGTNLAVNLSNNFVGSFTGDGNGLTRIGADQLIGTVPVAALQNALTNNINFLAWTNNAITVITNAGVAWIWFASGKTLRTNYTQAPYSWMLWDTNGIATMGTNSVTKITFSSTNGSGTFSTSVTGGHVSLGSTYVDAISGTGVLYVDGGSGGSQIVFTRNNTGTTHWTMNGSGHFLAGTDNTFDIGASSATRPRNLFIASNGNFGGGITASNPYAGPTSAAPANVTIGVTTPDTWFVHSNLSGVLYYVPGWTPH